jgi:hypothetical protein
LKAYDRNKNLYHHKNKIAIQIEKKTKNKKRWHRTTEPCMYLQTGLKIILTRHVHLSEIENF